MNPNITTERPQVNPFLLSIAHMMIWSAVAAGLYRIFFATRPVQESYLEGLGIPFGLALMLIVGINLYIRATRKRDQHDALARLVKEEKEIRVQNVFKVPLVISDRSADFVVLYQFLLSAGGEVIKVHPSFEEAVAEERLATGSKIKGSFVKIGDSLELLDRLVVIDHPPAGPQTTGLGESVLLGNVSKGKGVVREKFAAEALPRTIKKDDGIEFWYKNKTIPRSSSKAFKEDSSNKQRILLASGGLEVEYAKTKRRKVLTCVLQVNDDFVSVDWDTFSAVHQGDYVTYEMNYETEKGHAYSFS